MRVLVSRTDRIGDVVLTLPLCALLETQLGAEVVALGRAYSRPVFEACPYIADVIEWDSAAGERQAERDLLAASGADVILHVRPRWPIARAALAARIPRRIGTSHRWYHWLTCNELEHYGRRNSTLHEAQLNVRLAQRLLDEPAPPLDSLSRLTTLCPRVPIPTEVHSLLDPSRLIVVLHPGSGGSGRQWPLDHWHDLAWALDESKVQLLISGSDAEHEALSPWLATLPPHVTNIMGRLDIAELIAFLAAVDGIVAASTGPLHLAAALGRHALGLFPPTPPLHAGRWAPLGPLAEWLAPDGACAAHRSADGNASCDCMRSITVEAVKSRVLAWRSARTVALQAAGSK